jgi:hypothetical protein
MIGAMPEATLKALADHGELGNIMAKSDALKNAAWTRRSPQEMEKSKKSKA